MSTLEAPIYDELIHIRMVDDDEGCFPLVIHRSPDGVVAVAHTPMNEDDVKCAICESGVKVWIT